MKNKQLQILSQKVPFPGADKKKARPQPGLAAIARA